jgi:hypothetical protein
MQHRGSGHYNALLTEEQVVDILRLFHEDGIQMKQIAIHYRVNIVTVHDIVWRKTWTHILPDLYPPPKRDGRASITKEDVITIRQMAEDGMTQHAIARQFRMTNMQIWRIIHRKAWAHIE